jgi:hypothetical protein
LELFRQCGICCFSVRNSKYRTVGTAPISNRKTKNTAVSEQLQYLTEKNKKYCTVGTAPISNRKTINTTLSEQLQYLTEKQQIQHCGLIEIILPNQLSMCVNGIDFASAFTILILDNGAVPTVWYLLFFWEILELFR